MRRSPRVSQHQPCPNHILGKTYTEQGTQTLKVDRLARLQGHFYSLPTHLFSWLDIGL